MGKLDFGIGKFTAALAEIATVACFLVYIGTYYRSFAATRITFAVEVCAGRPPPPPPPPPPSRNSLHTGRAGVLSVDLRRSTRSGPIPCGATPSRGRAAGAPSEAQPRWSRDSPRDSPRGSQ